MNPEVLAKLERIAQSASRTDSRVIEKQLDRQAYDLVKSSESDMMVIKDYMFFYQSKKNE